MEVVKVKEMKLVTVCGVTGETLEFHSVGETSLLALNWLSRWR
tara:strand:- start:90 stop:218 length:129 start_codon:yes stop_codon:yes gene_type:complete